MGEVYVAGQNALRREVAIKKIKPEQLEAENAKAAEQAFICEALAMGFLDHPNIVPVYSLGRDQDGKWFFSMKMVRGTEWRSLLHPEYCKDPIAQSKAMAECLYIKDPVRRLEHLSDNLRIFDSVCNAIAFAHSKKVIHRDLKPENIMVGSYGEVLVMDWGLAVDVSENPPALNSPERRVPSRTECGMGGSPAYMAPEQCEFNAEGQYVPDDLNTWTDVFQLGAILYELLAGHPPFLGSTLRDVCLKVALCNPPELPETTPPELIAICKKAMARNPRERYPDAAMFQGVMQAFAKHHQAAMVASKAESEAAGGDIPDLARALVLYDEALALWPDNKDYRARREIVQGQLKQKQQIVRLTKWAAMGLAALVLIGVTVAYFNARARHVVAEKRAGVMMTTLDNQMEDLQVIFNLPGLQDVKKKLLGKAISGFQQMLNYLPDTMEAKRDVANSFSKLGQIALEIGETKEAADCVTVALKIRQEIAGAMPGDVTALSALAESYSKMGEILSRKGNETTAKMNFDSALVICENVLKTNPKNEEFMRRMATILMRRGYMMVSSGHRELGLADENQALQLRETVLNNMDSSRSAEIRVSKFEVAESCRTIAYALAKSGRKLDQARLLTDRAMKLFLELSSTGGENDSDIMHELSRTYTADGRIKIKHGDSDGGLAAFEKAELALQRLVDLDGMRIQPRRHLASAKLNKGSVYLQKKDGARALVAYSEAYKIRQDLAQQDPQSKEAKVDLVKSHTGLGDAYFLLEKQAEGFEEYEMSRSTLQELLDSDDDKENIQWRIDQADVNEKIGVAHSRFNQVDEAVESFKSALDIRTKLVFENMENERVLNDFAKSVRRLADELAKKK